MCARVVSVLCVQCVCCVWVLVACCVTWFMGFDVSTLMYCLGWSVHAQYVWLEEDPTWTFSLSRGNSFWTAAKLHFRIVLACCSFVLLGIDEAKGPGSMCSRAPPRSYVCVFLEVLRKTSERSSVVIGIRQFAFC